MMIGYFPENPPDRNPSDTNWSTCCVLGAFWASTRDLGFESLVGPESRRGR